MLFAERYEGSELCCRNALLLAQTQERDLTAPSPEVQAELAIKRETANPMYWGVWTLLRVRPSCAHCIYAQCISIGLETLRSTVLHTARSERLTSTLSAGCASALLCPVDISIQPITLCLR